MHCLSSEELAQMAGTSLFTVSRYSVIGQNQASFSQNANPVILESLPALLGVANQVVEMV